MGAFDAITSSVSSAVSTVSSGVSSVQSTASSAVDTATDTFNSLTGSSSTSETPDIPDETATSISWSDLTGKPSGLSDLAEYSDRLVQIAKKPESFVLGALFATALGLLLDVVKVFYDGISLALIGSEIGYQPGQAIGIEDVFYITWDTVAEAGGSVGSTLVGLISIVQQPAESIAGSGGALSWPLTVGVLAVSIAIAYVILTKIGRATLAAIPIIGPFLEGLLP